MVKVEYLSLVRDGIKLHGKLMRPGDTSCPLAIMFHGFGGDMGDCPDSVYEILASRLNACGIAVLRFDFNGHGKSEGDFSNMNVLNELEDAITILEYVRKQDYVTEIHIIGHSQGGVVAGMLAGYYADVISKLVLLAPAATLKTDALAGKCMMATYDTEHIPDVVNVDGIHMVGGHYFRIAKLLPIYEITAKFEKPALAIHGIYDEVVSVEASKEYQRRMQNCRLELSESLDHGLEGADKEKMIKWICDFLK